jgi:hypothetical protein
MGISGRVFEWGPICLSSNGFRAQQVGWDGDSHSGFGAGWQNRSRSTHAASAAQPPASHAATGPALTLQVRLLRSVPFLHCWNCSFIDPDVRNRGPEQRQRRCGRGGKGRRRGRHLHGGLCHHRRGVVAGAHGELDVVLVEIGPEGWTPTQQPPECFPFHFSRFTTPKLL